MGYKNVKEGELWKKNPPNSVLIDDQTLIRIGHLKSFIMRVFPKDINDLIAEKMAFDILFFKNVSLHQYKLKYGHRFPYFIEMVNVVKHNLSELDNPIIL